MTYGNEVLFYGLYNLTNLYRTRITHTCHSAIRIPGVMVLSIQDSGPLLTNNKNFGKKATRVPDLIFHTVGLPHPPLAVGMYAVCYAWPSTVNPCYTYDFDVVASCLLIDRYKYTCNRQMTYGNEVLFWLNNTS